jgi:D-glycero-D-manno-heptose 1,7-bisphosphate phosphatase
MGSNVGSRWLLILARDGVFNSYSADFVKSAEEWLPLPGSIAAIASLRRAG